MKKRFDVFVSSTSKDLYVYREQVRSVLVQRQVQPIMMEDFPAVSRDATELCKQKVEESDLFIGIYAKRYGYCPKGNDKSITEMEFEWAKQAKLETLIFVLSPDCKLEPSNPVEVYADTIGDSAAAVEKRQKLNDFLGRIGQTLVWKNFESPDQLARYTGDAVDVWLKEHASSETKSTTSGMVLTLLSMLLNLGLVIWTARTLLMTQYLPYAIGLLILAFFFLVLPFIFFRGSKQSVWTRIVWLLSGFSIFLFLRPILYQNLAETSFTNALTTTVLQDAQIHLGDAQTLGMDSQTRLLGIIEASISDSGSETNPQAIRAAQLLSPDVLSSEFLSSIETQSRDAITNNNSNHAKLSGQVLAYLAPNEAANLATSLNDEATVLLSSDNFSIEQARIMLETAHLIDETLGLLRNPEARSATLYNLAYVYELEGDNQAAIQAYHEAIEINERDVLARYAYSSLVLISSTNPEELDEAIQIAVQGQSYLPNNCQGAILLASSEASFDDKWNCFLLLTTEVGLRLKRDDNAAARPVLERAILLAENNANFGSAYYVAEAYYYLAQMDGDNVSRDSLCSIMLDYNAASPRHLIWADFAEEQLERLYPQERQCLGLED